jgi:hypothetical protein
MPLGAVAALVNFLAADSVNPGLMYGILPAASLNRIQLVGVSDMSSHELEQ